MLKMLKNALNVIKQLPTSCVDYTIGNGENVFS